jgi:hypothetical protein
MDIFLPLLQSFDGFSIALTAFVGVEQWRMGNVATRIAPFSEQQQEHIR